MVQLNLEIFISYSRKDKDLLLEFNSHLSPLLKRGKITLWFDRDIPAGAEWEHQINTHLNSAQIILLLTSDNFFASKYCEIEMTLAIKRSRAGDAIVIPIYLETSYEGEHRWEKAPWKKVPFSELQVLPRNGKSITSSPDCRAEAFVDVVNEIGKVAKRQFIEKAKNLSNNNNKQEALKVLEQAIDLDSEDADANRIKVKWLLDLNRKEEALTTLDQLLQLDPKDVDANWEKVKLLLSLNLKEKALVALEQVIHLAPNDASAYRIKVKMLKEFNRKEEALTTLDQLLRINPKDVDAYREKGEILLAIDRKK